MEKWYESAVFYHIYPLGMLGAEKTNDATLHHRLPKLHAWLPHLAELGISALYIGPLFESSTHGYDTKDYYQVDKRLGTNEEFKHFVKACHHHQIKVVVDGVFNHTGKAFFAFADLLTQKEASSYRYWYRDVDFSRFAPSGEPFYFTAWRNIYDLANLNLDNEEVRHYLFDVITFWIQEFDIDGIRLDCADCLPFSFMQEMRHHCEHQKTDFWLMGELIHGDYSRWINDQMLHSSTNYELHKALYSAHNDHNYFEIAHSIKRQFDENGGIYKGMHLYSFVDNHDVDRIASKLNHTDHLRNVYQMLFTLPGIPSLYYGSEGGITGKKEGPNDDPLRPYLELDSFLQTLPHPELIEEIKHLSHLHKTHSALVQGTYKELLLTNRQYAYARIYQNDIIVCAFNNDEESKEIHIPIPFAVFTARDYRKQEYIQIFERELIVTLPANSGNIFILD